MKQYRPAQEVTVNGKKFQRMIGAMVETASLQATLSYSVKEEEKVPPTDPAGPTKPGDSSNPGDSSDSSNPGTTEKPGDSADQNNPENPSNPTDTANNGSKESKKTTASKKAAKTTIATGDDFNPVLYGGVALLAIAGLFGIVRYRKKN